jgi:succinyl-CoA synthetase beta subunit
VIRRVAQNAPAAEIRGVIVQEQRHGDPVIIGTRVDPIFGPVIRIGEGGVDAEAHSSGAIALAPVDDRRAGEMVDAAQRNGVALSHGASPQSTAHLRSAVVAVSRLAWERRADVAGLEVNPLLLESDGVVAVDALVEFAKSPDAGST